MRERARHLDDVRALILGRFAAVASLHDIYLFATGERGFHVCVFFDTDKDAVAARDSGTQDAIINFLYAELERLGRGRRDEIKVTSEFDSHERVKIVFNGNYFKRLH